MEQTLATATRPGSRTDAATESDGGRIPRVSRLMALAIKFERLVREGAVQQLPGTRRGGPDQPGADVADHASVRLGARDPRRTIVSAKDHDRS